MCGSGSHSSNFLLQVTAAVASGLLQQDSLCDNASSGTYVHLSYYIAPL